MADQTETPTQAGAAKADGANGTTDGEATGNKFQQAIASWRALNFSNLVSNLDLTASDLVTAQQDTLVQRKELAQKTKEFRKLDDAGKLGEIKDLLKAYQGYIDVLTNHSKGVQAAFMQAYSPLSEAPDPYPLLEASIDSLITADEVMPRLESENERLQQQVTKLNSQLEESEKRLDAERNKRQSFEGSQDSRIKEVEESWSAVLKEKEENWAAKEKTFEEKTEGLERVLRELKASYEVSQRLDKTGEESHAVGSAAMQAELDIANSELEKANIRLVDLQSHNEQLRLELAQSAGQAHSSSRNNNVEDDPSFLRLRSENQSLMRKLESARYEKEAEKGQVEGRLRGLEREIKSLTADREALQAKLQKRSDYDELKRELEMLRAIEFATVGEDEVDAGAAEAANANGSADKSHGDNLEQLLLARNKKLSNELTELRVSHNELLQRFETLQEDLSSTNMDLEKAQKLNATLENDLQKTQQEASNAFETMSVAGTYTSRYPKSAYGSRRGAPGGGTSPTSSIIGGFDPSSGSGSPRGGGLGGDGGAGILPMVTAQRDRFKKKMGEMEQELQKQYQTVSQLRSEVASLQRDNLNLYEKTRYVSTYAHNRSQPATSGSSYGADLNPSTVPMGEDGKYRSAYESNISPFAAFRGRERYVIVHHPTIPHMLHLDPSLTNQTSQCTSPETHVPARASRLPAHAHGPRHPHQPEPVRYVLCWATHTCIPDAILDGHLRRREACQQSWCCDRCCRCRCRRRRWLEAW